MRKLFHTLAFVMAALLVALTGQSACAQGFMVKPMTMQVNPRPSQSLDVPLEIYNTAIDGPRTIQLRLVDLSQDDQGTWRLVESGSGDLSQHASSLGWTTLSDRTVSIGPQQPASITVKLRPPANARGYYFAGIIAETPVPANPVGVVVRVRFLIPLIIEIKGRTVHEHVAISDVAMTSRTKAGGTSTTSAEMDITNAGQTFSKVSGEVTVERQNGDQWRVVTSVPVKERGIIPGMTLKLGGDLQRSLPSGPYRLRANLFVDGRRVAPMQKLIRFAGDPNATVSYDATLILQPNMVDMKVVPGATRTTVLHIENTSADPVQIKMDSSTPPALLGVQMGQLVGTDLSAQPWTSIRPATFTLRPHGRQSVRVIASVPKTGADQANYYADMVLKGTYPDGQSAGETISTVHLANVAMKSVPDGSIEDLSLAQGEGAKFIAQLRLANIGNVDFLPSVKLTLRSSQGETVASVSLTGSTTGPLLPLGKRVYGGEFDFADVKPGDYSLEALVAIDSERHFVRQFLVSVVASAGRAAPDVTVSDPTSSSAALDLNQGSSVPLDRPGRGK